MRPDFSIIIPCYNDGRFLSRSIGSVLAQTNADWEVVLVDDGSDDDTAVQAQHWQHKLGERFQYVYQSNQGVSSARNHGLAVAQGYRLVFLDADDELKPTALADYDLHANEAWIIGGFEIERDGKIKTRIPALPQSRQQRFADYIEKKFHIGNISNMCFQADVFDEMRFAEELRVGEDLALFALLFTRIDPRVLSDITAQAHRRFDSLRTRSSAEALAGSRLPQIIFEHPLLDARYKPYARAYLARRGRSIMKKAYREGRYDQAVSWYEFMLKNKPGLIFNLKLLVRYLKSRLKLRTARLTKAPL
jgi:glycosyltransferase involved in cell wall biosynthesis